MMAFRSFVYNPWPSVPANYGSLAAGEPVVDCWSWKTFLAPLKTINFKLQTSSRQIRVASLVINKSLVERFSKNLLVQHLEKSKERDSKVSNAKGVLQSLLLSLPPLLIGGLLVPQDPFKVLEETWKHYESALKIKSDSESSGSTWTIDMLERYIGRQDIVFVQPENRLDLTGETLQRIYERVDLSIKAICGSSPEFEATVANLDELHLLHNTTLESDIRMILDAILQPLCVYKGLTIRTEQTITCNELPNNRYDFIMYSENVPVGVVEAKRQGGLNDKSVAQLLVQLLLLSAEEPDRFYFGVLSDSCRFIFAGVSSQKVVFFQTQGTFLEIATVKSEQDLTTIACKISWLADVAIRSRQKSIEHFLAPVTCLKLKDSFLNEVD